MSDDPIEREAELEDEAAKMEAERLEEEKKLKETLDEVAADDEPKLEEEVDDAGPGAD